MVIHSSLRRRILLLSVFIFIAMILLSPFASNDSMPSLLDLQCHLAAIMQAKIAITQGQFPLRVMPLEQNGWLYPYYQFYSATSYLLAGAVYKWLIPQSPYIALKFLILAANILGGIYLYRLSYWYCKSRQASLIASVAYLLAPYNIIVNIHLANFNEALALGIIPITLFYTLRLLYRPQQAKYLLKASAAWFVLASVHTITFIFTSLFCGLFILFLTIKNRLPFRNFFITALAYVFAWMLALWYLAPIILVAQHTLVASTFNNDIFSSLQVHLANLISPFFSTHASAGEVNSILKINPSLGLAIILGVGLAFYSLLSAAARYNWQTPLLILFACALILIWAPVDVWSWLPSQFKVIQYKWRLLNQTMWIGSLLLAGGLCWLFNHKLTKIHVILALVIIIISTSSFFPMIENSNITAEKFTHQNTLIYNKDSYLLSIQNYAINGIIDSFNLSSSGLLAQNDLLLNANFSFPHLSINPAALPHLVLRGFVNQETLEQHKSISLYVNHTFVEKKILQPGLFEWQQPLPPALFKDSQTPLKIKFTTEKVFPNNVPRNLRTIPMQWVLLQNPLDQAQIMQIPETEKSCRHFKTGLVCLINASKEIQTIELPVLYYPKLLEITLNNRVVNYSSVLYQGKLLATIHPTVGKNIISIQFVGLEWANFISAIAWIEWVIFGLYLVLRKYTLRT